MRPSFEILKYAYPIGSIYMSMNSTNPEKLFGGTWEQITGRFLWATQDTPGVTGGEKTHVLTEAEMPKHKHKIHWATRAYGSESGAWFVNTEPVEGIANTDYKDLYGYAQYADYAGGSVAHNNMPPYIDVYMWKRIG